MKNQLIIHIGQPKCGTTTIQRYLELNNNELIEQGIYYPELDHTGAHHQLSYFIRESTNPNHAFDTSKIESLVEKINQQNLKTIISSEDFWFNDNKDNLLALKKLFPKKDIKIILYLRIQDRYFESWYNEINKRVPGFNSSPDSFLENNYEKQGNYFEKVSLYSDVFGYENITLRPFDKSQWINENLLHDFLKSIDDKISIEKLIDIDNTNDRISNNSVKYTKLLSGMRLSKESHFSIMRDMSNLAPDIKTRFFSKEAMLKIIDQSRKSNQKLVELYSLSVGFFPEFIDIEEYMDYDTVSFKEDEIIEVIDNIYKRKNIKNKKTIIDIISKGFTSSKIKRPSKKTISRIRDIAINRKKVNPEISLSLLNICKHFRPKGPVINEAIKELT